MGGEKGGTPAPGCGWWGGPEGKKPPLEAMLLGGAPLKMRLKKSCRSAGLVGPVVCSEGDLGAHVGKSRPLYSLHTTDQNTTMDINLKMAVPVSWRIAVL